ERLESLRPYLERQAQLLNARVIGDREALYYPWSFQGYRPALIRPIFHVENARDMYVQLQGFLILEFNQDFLEQQYVPELVERHFGEPGMISFGVVVRTIKAPYRTIYASSANSAVSSSTPDAAVNLFESVGEEARRRGHELCTPLAVINSAAENIVDGVVEGPTQVQEYGTMIREQGRRLERLVDEVLLFAAGHFGRSGYDLRPTEVIPILEQSLSASETMLRDAGFAFQKEISQQLPLVIADPEAVSKCIENLISNAMKYCGENRWVSLRAVCAPHQGLPEVLISVEDRGIGISPDDLPHVFEPFYRSQGVRD